MEIKNHRIVGVTYKANEQFNGEIKDLKDSLVKTNERIDDVYKKIK